jgi:hypothetical protein
VSGDARDWIGGAAFSVQPMSANVAKKIRCTVPIGRQSSTGDRALARPGNDADHVLVAALETIHQTEAEIERLNNPNFKPVEFDGFRMQAGLNSFTLTPKQWIERTGAVGITSKPGRYGGTYAHRDIAFEFATWISMEFKL